VACHGLLPRLVREIHMGVRCSVEELLRRPISHTHTKLIIQEDYVLMFIGGGGGESESTNRKRNKSCTKSGVTNQIRTMQQKYSKQKRTANAGNIDYLKRQQTT
jgi:hypothetical protein